MKKIAIPLMLLITILVSCSKSSVFNVNENIELKGDYSNSEVFDFLENERPEYISTSKLICEKEGKCIMIMEIDYNIFSDMLIKEFDKCNIDIKNIDYGYKPTEEQIECTKEVWQSLGIQIPN